MNSCTGMCTLCGHVNPVEAGPASALVDATALAWAGHFHFEHPEVEHDLSQFMVITPNFSGIRS